MRYNSTEVDKVSYFVEERDSNLLVLKKANGHLVEVPIPKSPRGEIGKLEVWTNQALSGVVTSPVPNAILPVFVKDRSLKVSLSATLASTVAATLGGIVLYEDASIIEYIYWTSPSNGSYQTVATVIPTKPTPGWHVYNAYLANFSGSGLYGIFTSPPPNKNIGLKMLVEEV